jgi:DNA-binding response OmpR family regulator
VRWLGGGDGRGRPGGPEPAARPERTEDSGSNPHVLVIDSSLTARMDIRAALHGAGFHVTACDSKASARQALRSRTYALAILDAVLPDGSGLDLIKEIRTIQTSRLPIVLVGSDREARDRMRIAAAVADEYLTKPYEMTRLLGLAIKLAGSSIVARRPHERPHEATSSSQRGAKLLVADSAPAYRKALAESLRVDGHEVVVAGSTDEALALLAIERVDAVILDYRLPERGGLDTCRRIRSQSLQRFVQVLMVAGASDDVDAYRKAIAAGANDLVMRSPETTIVKVRLRGLLQREQESREPRARPATSAPVSPPSAWEATESAGDDRISRITSIPAARPSQSPHFASREGVDSAGSAGWPSHRDAGEDRISGVVPVSAASLREWAARRTGSGSGK